MFAVYHFEKNVVGPQDLSVRLANGINELKFMIQIEYLLGRRTAVELSCVRHVAL